jgi:hypothetical protein
MSRYTNFWRDGEQKKVFGNCVEQPEMLKRSGAVCVFVSPTRELGSISVCRSRTKAFIFGKSLSAKCKLCRKRAFRSVAY